MADADVEAMIEAEPFGTGTSRVAHRIVGDPEAIVKRSLGPRNFGNMFEWILWCGARDVPALSTVLGRCHCLSETGRYLIMERLDDIGREDYAQVPDVPAWFNDPKPSAFGKRDGAIRIRDYGLVHWDRLLDRSIVKPPAFAVGARTAALIGRT